MNDTAKICREISDSADMGKLALSRLIKRCRDASFCSVMADMFANYHELYNDAQEIIRELGRHDSGASPRQKKPMLIGLALNTAIDSTPSHLSEMLVQGCAMSHYKHCPGGKRMRPRGCKGNVLMQARPQERAGKHSAPAQVRLIIRG